LPTTKLIDDVFRSLNPSNTGLVFAAGLSPFAVVCEGHTEMDAVQKLIKQAELAESGTSMSLADADRLTSTDVRFPVNAQTAAEKLYGWSILVDVFHGHAHDISTSIQHFVTQVGPALHRVAQQHAENQAVGMDLVCRVLYEAQQDYFSYVTALANGVHVACPTFGHITSKVLTYRTASLSALPASWYTLLNGPRPERRNRAAPADSHSSRAQAGAVSTFNANPDPRLVQRFRDSGHATISAMMQGHDAKIPKHNGKPVCLVWALKGECSASCKRKDQHVRYPGDTAAKIHDLMTTCGVANPQE
jgi:hypothetical protein